ncbi:MAG: hypothetical protein M3083_25615 [Actinomycetota bacterium]|nr:hypothetical protein [Actinomycetota bacterium]
MAGAECDLHGRKAEVLAVGLHELPQVMAVEVFEPDACPEAGEVLGDGVGLPGFGTVDRVREQVAVVFELTLEDLRSLLHHLDLAAQHLRW